jgi:hypothetical protein
MDANETMEKEVAKCEFCGKPLGPGRIKRKYCDAACKSEYWNERNREDKEGRAAFLEKEKYFEEMSIPDYIKRIQDILLRNRKILEGLCGDGQPRRMRMRELLGKEFNPKFFTSQAEPTDQGHVYRFCFEYGYWEKDNGDVVIICREREVEF